MVINLEKHTPNSIAMSGKFSHELLRNHHKEKLIVTMSENSYEHAVYNFASLLAGFTLFPINPNLDLPLI